MAAKSQVNGVPSGRMPILGGARSRAADTILNSDEKGQQSRGVCPHFDDDVPDAGAGVLVGADAGWGVIAEDCDCATAFGWSAPALAKLFCASALGCRFAAPETLSNVGTPLFCFSFDTACSFSIYDPYAVTTPSALENATPTAKEIIATLSSLRSALSPSSSSSL